MSDGHDPRVDAIRPPSADRALRPVHRVNPVVRKDAARAYRDVEHPPGPPRRADAGSILVGQIMSHPVHTLPIDATADDAAELMSAMGIRHVPVVDASGRLAGLVSSTDLFTAARAHTEWAHHALQRIMVTDVTTLSAEMSLHEAARRLSRRGLFGGPVTDPTGRPVGFLSARDLLSVLVKRAPLTLWV